MLDEDRPLYAALEARLREMGLARVAEQVLALARPAITLGLERTEETAIGVGDTKVGGVPDLPPAMEWPSWQGRPLPFIAQIRLEEIAVFEPEGDLPHIGLLSFFYALYDPDDNLNDGEDSSAWRVVYTEDTTRLTRRPLPDALADGPDTAFPACAVGFGRRLTLPDSQTAMIEALQFTNDERLAYTDLVGGSSAGFESEMDHRLLGYPYTLEPDPFYRGYLARNGIAAPPWERDPTEDERRQRAMGRVQEAAKEWRPPAQGYHSPEDVWGAIADISSRVDMDALTRAVQDLEPPPAPADYQRQVAALRRAAEAEWRLLLQVYSNEEAQMDWAGGGVIHFGVSRADLAARDFSRVWVNLDFV